MKLEVSNLTGNFEKDLAMWGEEVVEYCNITAKEINRAFYAFQSQPVEKPKVLILGINPHCDEGEGSFEGQINNTALWKPKEGKITAEVFCKENPCWEKEHHEWKIWKKIETIFHTPELKNIITKNKFVYMNALHFSTTNMREFYNLKNAKQIFEECVNYTKFLIRQIIKPTHIICLSIPDCFDRLNKIKPEEAFSNGKVRVFIESKFCEIPMYGIPHPSGSRNMDMTDWHNIGVKIHNKIFDEKIFEINAQEVVDYFRENPLGEITENSKKIVRFTINGIDNDKLEVTFTTDEGGYWGIKAAQTSNDHLQHIEKYIELLQELGLEIYCNVWLGEKWFKCYDKNITEEIKNTIEKFILRIETQR